MDSKGSSPEPPDCLSSLNVTIFMLVSSRYKSRSIVAPRHVPCHRSWATNLSLALSETELHSSPVTKSSSPSSSGSEKLPNQVARASLPAATVKTLPPDTPVLMLLSGLSVYGEVPFPGPSHSQCTEVLITSTPCETIHCTALLTVPFETTRDM